MNAKITVLLAEDHSTVREGLRLVLEKQPDMKVIAEADNGDAALLQARELSPTVVVMDVTMPSIDGVEATRQIIAENPGVRVLILSAHCDRAIVTRVLEAGAIGYVSKAACCDELLRGIRAVAAGKPYLCQEVSAILVNTPNGLEERGAATKLGRREIEVLRLVVDGRNSASIARRMFIAPGTVDVHRRNIMRKLDLHNIVDLTKYAIRQGLVSN